MLKDDVNEKYGKIHDKYEDSLIKCVSSTFTLISMCLYHDNDQYIYYDQYYFHNITFLSSFNIYTFSITVYTYQYSQRYHINLHRNHRGIGVVNYVSFCLILKTLDTVL